MPGFREGQGFFQQPANIKRFFSRRNGPNPRFERQLALLRTRSGVSVLDIGPGPGYLAIPLAADGCRVVGVEPANPKGIEIRGKIENAMFKLGETWRAKDFAEMGEGDDRLNHILNETSRCIKCKACIENCPICYCVDCSTKNPVLVPPGRLPVAPMFHLIRFAHVVDSCVNCGQCEENCPMEIPNTRFMHANQVELQKIFGYRPGCDMRLRILALVEERTERQRLSTTGSDPIYLNVFNPSEPAES